MKQYLLFLSVGLFSLFAKAQEVTGSWSGALEVQGMSLTIAIHVKLEDGVYSSTFDSPDQGAYGIPFDRTTFEGGRLTCHAPAMGVIYEAALDGAMLKGHWSQAGQKFPLDLHRTTEGSKKIRPQLPKMPYPYHQKEVEIQRIDAQLVLRGTLTFPEGEGPFPGAVLISGSGPQNRDMELLGHQPFLVLTDYLTRQGIAVLRYDDRGTAASTGDFDSATTADLADDAEAAWRFMASQPHIQQDRIGFIGISEGGVIGPMVAARNQEVHFVVMMAGPAVPGDALLMAQGEAIMRAHGEPEEKIASVLQGNMFFYQWLKGHDTAADAAADFDRFVDSLRQSAPEHAEALLASRSVVEGPWYHYFLRYDPVPALRQMNSHALAIFGGKDTQVPAALNVDALQPWFVDHDSVRTIEVFDQCNHLFQTAKTGAPSEYAQIEETMAPEVMAFMADWLLAL